MSRHRVLLVHDGNEAGGLEQVMLELATGLSERHEVAVLVRGYEADGWSTPRTFVDELARLEIAVLRPATGRSRWKRVRQLREFLSTRRLIRRFDPTVVHIHTSSVEGARVQTCASWLAGSAVIRTEHNSPTAYSRKPFDSPARRAADRMTALVLTVSEHDRREQIDVVGRSGELVKCVHNGVDTERFAPTDDAGGGAAPDRLLVVSVGRLVDQKNHAQLVRAIARIEVERSKFDVEIAGTGPLMADLVGLTEELEIRNLRFTGHTDDVPALLDRADIGVMPSRHEGLSIAALEMMSAGLPVIVNDHPGLTEIVSAGVTGLVVPIDDHEALALALAVLIDDPALRARLGAAARRAVVDDFSSYRFVDRTVAHYDEVATR